MSSSSSSSLGDLEREWLKAVRDELSAVEFALGSFAETEVEEDRQKLLRAEFSNMPLLKPLLKLKVEELKTKVEKLKTKKAKLLELLLLLVTKEAKLLELLLEKEKQVSGEWMSAVLCPCFPSSAFTSNVYCLISMSMF
jgi:hypothetical protein